MNRRRKIKNKHKERAKKIKAFRKKIEEHKHELWLPNLNVNFNNVEINSCFTIKEYVNIENVSEMNSNNLTFEETKTLFKASKINIKPTERQHFILQSWFDSFISMYNASVKFIRRNQQRIGRSIFNWKNLRTNHLKDVRDVIKMNSKIDQEAPEICTHLLDEAIKLCCASYKSAFTNLRKGHIKHFLIKYMKFNKDTKILKIEKEFFRGQRSFLTTLPASKENGESFNLQDLYNNYQTTTVLYYDTIARKYYLFVPETIQRRQNNNEKKIFSGDLGVRTFLTGLTENEVVKIGSDFQNKIKDRLKKIDKVKKMNIPAKKKKKVERLQNIKIRNIVTELHWKTINYLTQKYQTILIGNLSVKGIVSKKTSVLNGMTKRIAIAFSFYKFKERLKYKCQCNKIICREIDESYTSKICSNCGYYKKDLGGNKIYECNSCGIKIDRDVGGSRGIYLKSK